MSSAARQDVSRERTSRTAVMPAEYRLSARGLHFGLAKLASYWPAMIPLAAFWGVYSEQPLLVEACIYLGLLAVFYRGVRRLFIGIPRSQRRLIATFVALMIVGQLISKSRETFPFVFWGMYTQSTAASPAAYYEYSARLRSGREVLLDLPRGRVQWPLLALAKSISRGGPAAQQRQLIERYEHDLLIQARIYDSKHLDDPLQAISVTRCEIPLDTYRGKSSIERKPFWHVNVR